MASRVVAIDGPAGSGKSSTARAVARRLGLAHLDSGSLYRALTVAALDREAEIIGPQLASLARTLPVRLTLIEEEFRPEVAGVDVSGQIRSARVNGRVSEVAALPDVRRWVNDELRAAAALHPRGVVVDGRDIGTVVFPDAAVKVFLTASKEERARRRLHQEGHETHAAALRRTSLELSQRDVADSTREVAPLQAAKDSVLIDTTSMAFEEQVAEIVQMARKNGWQGEQG